MLNAVGLSIGLAVTWFLWSGHTELFVLGLGLLSVAIVLFVAIRMEYVDEEAIPLHIGFGLIAYWVWLVKEMVKANIDVAKIVLSPQMPISPSLTKVKALSDNDLGRVIFANSITLTPGTVSTDIHDGVITVHALTLAGALDVEAGGMNRRVAALDLRHRLAADQ